MDPVENIMNKMNRCRDDARPSGSSEPPCSPPYELACRMLNAIGWDGTNFRLRDPVAMAIAPEVERLNRKANSVLDGSRPPNTPNDDND